MKPLYIFTIFWKQLPGLWQKLKMLQRYACWKNYSLCSWYLPWGTLWWISIDIMICKWEFWFFDLIMAIFSLLECFATFNKLPILERSIAVRGACFFFLFKSFLPIKEIKLFVRSYHIYQNTASLANVGEGSVYIRIIHSQNGQNVSIAVSEGEGQEISLNVKSYFIFIRLIPHGNFILQF